MHSLTTKNYYKKKIVNFFFNEEHYNLIKLYKIIWDYKIGKPYDEIIKIFPYLLKVDDIVFDIGANMGQYACRLSKILPGGRIFSFEPVQDNYKALFKMKFLLKLKNVETFQLALSDKIGTEKIYIPLINKNLIDGTQASLEESKKNYENVSYKIETAETNTIDNLVERMNLEKIAFIKIDTEGAEMKVLRGGKETIKNFKPFMKLEINHKNKELEYLYEDGYEPFYFMKNKFLEADRAVKLKEYPGDVILIHKNNKKNFSKFIE